MIYLHVYADHLEEPLEEVSVEAEERLCRRDHLAHLLSLRLGFRNIRNKMGIYVEINHFTEEYSCMGQGLGFEEHRL